LDGKEQLTAPIAFPSSQFQQRDVYCLDKFRHERSVECDEGERRSRDRISGNPASGSSLWLRI